VILRVVERVEHFGCSSDEGCGGHAQEVDVPGHTSSFLVSTPLLDQAALCQHDAKPRHGLRYLHETQLNRAVTTHYRSLPSHYRSLLLQSCTPTPLNDTGTADYPTMPQPNRASPLLDRAVPGVTSTMHPLHDQTECHLATPAHYISSTMQGLHRTRHTWARTAHYWPQPH